MSYQGKVYRAQGGNEIVVASSGKVTIESGGHLAWPVETGTTTAALAAMGLSICTRGTTATGANTYTIKAPIVGVPKWIAVLLANSSDNVTVAGETTGITFGSTLMPKVVVGSAGTVAMIGRTTAIYDVINVGSTVTPAPLVSLTS